MQHFSIVTHTTSFQPSPTKTLPTIGGNIQITGTLKVTLNLGLSRLLSFDFYLVGLAYGIVGPDFLTRHSLTVNLTARQLIESLEVERATFHNTSSSLTPRHHQHSNYIQRSRPTRPFDSAAKTKCYSAHFISHH